MSTSSPDGKDTIESAKRRRDNFDRNWLLKLVQQQTSSSYRRSALHQDKILATAPMIEQSDTAFRILTRRYGANLCYTPMIHAHTFVKKEKYRKKLFHFCDRAEDRPLIGQIAGSNAAVLLECAKLIENYVDAIDINLGCPTQAAKRGRYGAYLLGSGQYVVDMVQHLVEHLSIPVTCKVRLLPVKRKAKNGEENDDHNGDGDNDVIGNPSQPPEKHHDLDASIYLYQALIDAGASALTIHGRTKDMKGHTVGKADWDAIKTVVQKLGSQVPILANGNLACYNDVVKCLEYTGADGVMSSEAILEYPPQLYLPSNGNEARPGPGRLAIAREYLELARQYPPEQGNGASGMQCLQMHMQTFLHGEMIDGDAEHLQSSFAAATCINDLFVVLDQVEERHRRLGHRAEDETLSWYYRHWESPP